MSKITLEFKLSNPITKDEREGLVHSATWLMRIAGHECVLAEPTAAPKTESPKKRKAKKKPTPPVTLEMPAVEVPDSGAPMPVVEVPEIPAAPMPPAPPVSAQPAPDAVIPDMGIPTSEDLAFPALAEIVMTALNNNDLENLDVVNTVTSFGLQSFADLTGRPDLVNPVADKIKALILSRKAEA